MKKMKSGRKKVGLSKGRTAKQLGPEKKVKRIPPKFKKFLKKKARDYNSDGEDGIDAEVVNRTEVSDDHGKTRKPMRVGRSFEVVQNNLSKGGDENDETERETAMRRKGRRSENTAHTIAEASPRDENSGSDREEDDEIEPGITMFSQGCRAFRIAFKSIMKSSGGSNPSNGYMGPILSANKKLVTEKLVEEIDHGKNKHESAKKKHQTKETGHVKPSNFLDSHEKFLIGVATKGVVKLFNAVNKSQNAQKGFNPSRTKDAKVLKKRRKEVFFSELAKDSSVAHKGNKIGDPSVGEEPSWAPLRDNYMLTSSKLKDWDKMTDNSTMENIGQVSKDSDTSDDD